HPRFLDGTADTTFVDRTPELLQFPERKDRGTRILRYIASTTVNLPENLRVVDRSRLPEAQPPVVDSTAPWPEGTKQLLDRLGPEGLARWVKEQKRLLVTDTTFRDAHQSLLATRVRTYDLLKVAESTGRLLPELFSLEMWGG